MILNTRGSSFVKTTKNSVNTPLLILLGLICSANIFAESGELVLTQQTEKRSVSVSKITSGLNHPWSIAFISETEWLVTERAGQLRRIINGELQDKPVTGLPEIRSRGQGGLLDVALHPEFDQNRWVYLSYSGSDGSNSGTEVMRGILTENNMTDIEVIFKATPKSRGGRHFGSRLVFDDEGFLFISLGDRGAQETAQHRDKHAGSIIRLNDDGSVPTSNPFVNTKDALPEIYSYGHRNVQGMTFDSSAGTLWAHEHGPQGGDELNQVFAGQNYGWPIITYGVNYGTGTKIGEGTEKDGMLQPVTFWDPSIAPSGLAILNSPKFPEWQGNLLVGALKFQLLARLEIVEGRVVHEERLLEGELGRIRDVRQGPDGHIYLLTDSDNGAVYRLD